MKAIPALACRDRESDEWPQTVFSLELMSHVKKVTKNPSEGTWQEAVMTYSALQLQYYPEGTGEYLAINGVPAGIRMWKLPITSRKPCGLSKLGYSVLI
jgi:hypothetical protein